MNRFPSGSRESDDFKDNCVNPLLPEESFQRYVIPELFRVFHVYNVHIRLTLLRHFESYVHLFDADTLRDFIFPQVLKPQYRVVCYAISRRYQRLWWHVIVFTFPVIEMCERYFRT